MDTRLLASACWLIGALAIGAAFLLPEVRYQAFTKPGMSELERKVGLLAERQSAYHDSSGSFLYFGPGDKEQTDAAKTLKSDGGAIFGGDFVFDTVSGDKAALVIRGYAAATAVQSGKLPPMMYRYERGASSDAEAKTTWIAPVGHRPGLIAPLLALLNL